MSASARFSTALRTLRWLPSYGIQQLRSGGPAGPADLIVSVADHFEPAILPDTPHRYASREEQIRRVERWCRDYPAALDAWRDVDGYPLRHTYFYPAEQYDDSLIARLAEHCHGGWGEIEIHLHHGVDRPDSAGNTRRALAEFRDRLAGHGCLSRWNGRGIPRYAFVHGNWALANSGGGRFCGVDGEMQILAETGCYADLTLPSAPNNAQVAKINALYECALPLDRRAPHRRGRDLAVGRSPKKFPLIVEGPLAIDFTRRAGRWRIPGIENAALTAKNPPTMQRMGLWRRAAVGVHGRPDWIFIKLHCHGMDPRDQEAMYGDVMKRFLHDLFEHSKQTGDRVHFVTAREMVNIILAACDGRAGRPGDYRDYRLALNRASAGATAAARVQ